MQINTKSKHEPFEKNLSRLETRCIGSLYSQFLGL